MDTIRFTIKKTDPGDDLFISFTLYHTWTDGGFYSSDAPDSLSGNTSFTVTGFTTDKIAEVTGYNGKVKAGENGVTAVTDAFTAYTINDISYITTSGGTTSFSFKSYGFSGGTVSTGHVYKEDNYMGFSDMEEENNVFIERNGFAVFERLSRLSEIRSLNQLINYNRNYFNVSE